MTIKLTDVADGQLLIISLTGANDNFGRALPNTTIAMQTLFGDTTGDGVVNASDITLAKSQIGQQVAEQNFFLDVNADGQIDASDMALIKSHSGASLPGTEDAEQLADVTVPAAHAQALSFSGPRFIKRGTRSTFTVSTNLTFSGYGSYGLSYWLEVDDALARFIRITNATYFTFLDPTQTSPVPFDSAVGASPGYTTASRDLGATSQAIPQDVVPPGTYHITDITFALGSEAPLGTYRLRSTTLLPRRSETTDTDFQNNDLGPTSTFTFTIVAAPRTSPSPRPRPTPK
jgi:hypothetical protein